jgi:hypothetical protein
MTVVIAAVPLVETTEILMAPALLKACLNKHDISAVALDLNIDIVNRLKDHPKSTQIKNFFFTQNIDPDVIDEICDIIDYCAEKICQQQPTVIALSLLTYSCQIFTRWLCAKLRSLAPDVKIVIGGTGIKNFIADFDNSFCQQCVRLNLIDDYITGDGEVSFVEYIKGNLTYPGINSDQWQRTPDLNVVPFPDYSDYDFEKYELGDIPLCDSRGCVKNCEFCDVIEYWTKFQWRSAENIFQEMLWQIQKYQRHSFSLRSSLVNGNMKEFRLLLDLICNYNQDKPRASQISWKGYFIVRTQSQHPPELWEKLRNSNGTLIVGVESVVSRVRHGMGKTFSNEDLDYHLAMGKKFQVSMVLLMIVGYPTETQDDYEFTKQWIKDRKNYANDTVVKIGLSLASVLPNTQLSRNASKHNLKLHPILPSVWINQNLKITSTQRVEYLKELLRICKEDCGFNFYSNEQTIEHSLAHDNLY